MSEKDIAALLTLIERALGKQYLELADWIREQNDLGEIEERIRRGDWAGAVRRIEDAALRMAAEIHGSYIQAGVAAARWLDEQPQTADRLVRFDATNTRAVERARRNQLELVQGYTAEQRETSRVVIADGIARGANPRDIARNLRDGLGLTPTQAEHVLNYRRELESGQFGAAMSRELHDGRRDRTLARLAEQGKPLPPDVVDKLVDRYRTNYVNYRAEVIARTEALRSVHEASAENVRQAVERGDIRADQITQTWHAARDARTRQSHRAMDGQQRKFGEAFVTATGASLRYPGDPAAPVAETAQCRCSVSTSLL